MKKRISVVVLLLLLTAGTTVAVHQWSQQDDEKEEVTLKESSGASGETKRSVTDADKNASRETLNSATDESAAVDQQSDNEQAVAMSDGGSRHAVAWGGRYVSPTQPSATPQANVSHSGGGQSGVSVPPATHPSSPVGPIITPPVNPQPPVTPPVTPPVAPPTTPPVTPTPPVDQPTPPQPPITPPVTPTPPQTDEDKARAIIAHLKTPNNDNVAQFTNDEGQIRTVLWAKGITAPRLGAGGDFRRVDEVHGGNRYVTYTTGQYRQEFINHGWYDTDKSPNSSPVDINLCFGAVASNQLYWWMNYHKGNIEKFIQKTNYVNALPAAQRGTLRDLTTFANSFHGPQSSRVFDMMKVYFGNNREGYYADPLLDMFINGHTPKANGGFNDPDWPHDFQLDSRGGFFHQVFGTRNLTRRLTMSSLPEFGREIKKAFQNGETVGLIHMTSGNYTHIITGWGAEYDLDGNVVGVYVTDSDDQTSPENGMKRYGVKNINGKPAFSNNLSNPNSGARIDQMSTLGLGEEKWKEFLR